MRAVGINVCTRRAFGLGARPVHGLGVAKPVLLGRPGLVAASGPNKVPLVTSIDEDAENVTGDFCSLDDQGKKAAKRTVGEMEQVCMCCSQPCSSRECAWRGVCGADTPLPAVGAWDGAVRRSSSRL